PPEINVLRLVFSLAIATLIFYLANSAAVATAMALVTGKSVRDVWRKNLVWTSLSNVTGALIAAVVVLKSREKPEEVFGLVALVSAIVFGTYYIYRGYLKRVEKLMQRSQFLQAILNSVSAYIAILDEEGKILAVNRSWEGFSGQHEVLGPMGSEGDNLPDLLSLWPVPDSETAQTILEGIRRTACSQDSSYSREYCCGQEREKYWFHLQVSRFLDDGRVRVVVEFADVTRSKNLEEQLRHAQKMEAIGRLAGGVAHDFNNILTIISGYATFLQEALGEDPKLRKYVETILEASDRAGAVTRQLLAFSRKQVLEPQVVELNSLVADTEKLLQRLIGEDIELITLFDPDAGKIRADPNQFAQVLINLVVNSRDAMPSGGQLRVETSSTHLTESDLKTMKMKLHSGDYACLRVRDTGDGMDSEILDHIFEPFFTTKEKGKGTGLGLSTVYGIVKQSGGDIDVASVKGKGTVFEIYLPQVLEGILQHEPLAAPAKARPAPGRSVAEPSPRPLGQAPPEPAG
ncbi:MAG: ATP-binding protein, partial [Acidobacteriota bacterium]